ncbi:MAG: transposase [Desulfobulbaceae bacterium]|nr:transposase [Desulfobulbaceae bacterium]
MKSRFTVEQILAVLELKRDGAKLTDICRQYKFSKQTYYRWKAKYGWMIEPYATVSNILADEKRCLQKFINIPGVDIDALRKTLR